MALIYPVAEDKKEGSIEVKEGIIVLPQYLSYSKVFVEARPKALTYFNKYIYIINLEGGAVPLFGPIYPLAEPELEVLREYLNNAVRNNQI